MAIHSSILAWKISWAEDPGGLQSMRQQSVRHYWAHTHKASKEDPYENATLFLSPHFPEILSLLSLAFSSAIIFPSVITHHSLFPLTEDSVRSIQFSRSVVSNSLQPHESQHARPPCPSPTPRVYSNSHPSSWWCHPAISSSVVPFSSCPQSLPASGSFPKSQLFTWGGQSIGVSASASVLPMNTQNWSPFRMDWLDLLAAQGTLKSLLQHHSSSVVRLVSEKYISTVRMC